MIGQHKTTPPKKCRDSESDLCVWSFVSQVACVFMHVCACFVCLNQWSSPDTRWPHKSLFVDHLSGGTGPYGVLLIIPAHSPTG